MNEHEPKNSKDSTEHPFDRLMFGTRQVPLKSEGKPIQSTPSSSTDEQFDLITMIKSVDELMGSVNKLKPIAKQLGPLFEIFKTKK